MKTLKRSKLYLKILFMMILFIIPVTTVYAATLKIQYDGKNYNYTGKQVQYVLDGKTLNYKAYPGIIINGISIAPAMEVFSKSSIGASYKLNGKSITISKNDITIKMTLNSKTAYVNGVKKTLSLPPKKVTYKSSGVTKVLVPARFVAEALGYTYTWNSSTSIASLEKPLLIYYKGKWRTYKSTIGSAVVNNKNIDVSDMPVIIENNTALVNADAVLVKSNIKAKCTYNASNKQITIKKGDITVKMTADSKIAYVNGKKYTMATAARRMKNNITSKSYNMIPASFIAKHLGYNYKWDSAKKQSVFSEKPVINTPVENTDYELYFNQKISGTIEEEYNKINADTLVSEINGNYTGTDAYITGIIKDTEKYTDREVYAINSDFEFSTVSSSFNESNNLVINFENASSLNTTYFFDSAIISNVNSSSESNGNVTFSITLNCKLPKYNLSISEDKKTIYLTIYNNYITEINAEQSKQVETITLKGLYLPEVEISEDETNIYLDIKNTVNGLGEINKDIDSKLCLKNILVTSTADNCTRVILNKTSTSKYSVSEINNEYILTLYDEVLTDYALQISKPEDVKYSDIENTDLYTKNQFKITIPGDYVNYYENNPVICTKSVIESIYISLNSKGNTDILVTTTKLQGYKISDSDDSIRIQVDNPSNVYKNIVILDPGHGGKFPGTSKGSVVEKDLTLKILYTCAKKYFDSPTSEVKAYYTRTSDITLDSVLNKDLNIRAQMAQKYEADLFISLHINAIVNKPTVNGTEVYYANSNKNSTDSGLTSKILASKFCDNLTSTLGTYNRGVKMAEHVVTKANSVPAILIELGFITSTKDFANMTNASFQNKTAKAIYDTTCSIFKQYPTGRN